MNQTNDQTYQQLKKKCTFSYKGYAMEKILSTELLLFVFAEPFHKQIMQKEYTLRKLLMCFVRVPDISFLKKYLRSKGILFSVFFDRKDYHELISGVSSGLPSSLVLAYYQYDSLQYQFGDNCKKYFSIRNTVSSFFQALYKLRGFTTKEFLYFWALICYYKNLLDRIEKQVPDPDLNAFVAFNSSFSSDTVLTLYLQKKGIQTYSLQHGVYTDYKEFIPLDRINYENFCADRMLCWGEWTRTFMSQWYAPERLVLAGNPKYPSADIPDVKTVFKKGLVLLPRSIYDEGNRMLIAVLSEIAKNNSIDFSIKLHPSLNKETYAVLCAHSTLTLLNEDSSVKELLTSGRFDFTVAYNTTAYYESLLFGLPSLRYAYMENENLPGTDDHFTTADGFQEVIHTLRQKHPAILKTEYEELIRSVLGAGVNRYKEILAPALHA